MSSAANYPVSWFGVVQLPDLVMPSEDLKEVLEEVHEGLFVALLSLAGLHVLAALKHQFVDRDGLLWRMLPWGGRD
jgi:cytochrome b561